MKYLAKEKQILSLEIRPFNKERELSTALHILNVVDGISVQGNLLYYGEMDVIEEMYQQHREACKKV